MRDIRCCKCNKKLGETPNKYEIVSASCDTDKIIYKVKCPRCKHENTILFKY